MAIAAQELVEQELRHLSERIEDYVAAFGRLSVSCKYKSDSGLCSEPLPAPNIACLLDNCPFVESV